MVGCYCERKLKFVRSNETLISNLRCLHSLRFKKFDYVKSKRILNSKECYRNNFPTSYSVKLILTGSESPKCANARRSPQVMAQALFKDRNTAVAHLGRSRRARQ